MPALLLEETIVHVPPAHLALLDGRYVSRYQWRCRPRLGLSSRAPQDAEQARIRFQQSLDFQTKRFLIVAQRLVAPNGRKAHFHQDRTDVLMLAFYRAFRPAGTHPLAQRPVVDA